MKVLVISHNCFSSTQNMGKTLSTLFCEFSKDEIMQLYFYPSLPNIKNFDNYYRITDKDVIRSIARRNKCGRKIFCSEINEENKLFENEGESKVYKEIKQNKDIIRRARDILWKIGNWKTKDLKRWLKTEKPDVVFYALGDATFSQNIAMWVAKYLNIPLVTYVCDDFYFCGKQAGFTNKVLNFGLVKNIKKTIKSSKRVISICDQIGEDYQEAFDTPYTTVMTGASFEPGSLDLTDKKQQLSYIGNLSVGRWESLLEIQNALNGINKETNSIFELVYYGNENENLVNKVKYGGFLAAQDVKEVMAKSLLIIHTESFNDNFKSRVKYSVSTKIADSLASGTCLLAYGPDEIASIKYLRYNRIAFCIGDNDDLSKKLAEIITNDDLRKEIEQNALHLAKNNHTANNNSKLLRRTFETVISNI